MLLRLSVHGRRGRFRFTIRFDCESSRQLKRRSDALWVAWSAVAAVIRAAAYFGAQARRADAAAHAVEVENAYAHRQQDSAT